jgi:hypothetical protein
MIGKTQVSLGLHLRHVARDAGLALLIGLVLEAGVALIANAIIGGGIPLQRTVGGMAGEAA